MEETITAYPLSWPAGWPRTPRGQVRNSRYSQKTMARVREEIQEQVRLLGGKELILSTNIALRRDGLPYSGQKQPTDCGVAVYFSRKGRPFCFASDKWLTVEENLWAICLTIEALRRIERCGVSDMLDRAFTGFLALPAPQTEAWWDVLGVPRMSDWEDIQDAYRELAKVHHPDKGGDKDSFVKIANAYTEAKAEKELKNPRQAEMDEFVAGMNQWREGL